MQIHFKVRPPPPHRVVTAISRRRQCYLFEEEALSLQFHCTFRFDDVHKKRQTHSPFCIDKKKELENDGGRGKWRWGCTTMTPTYPRLVSFNKPSMWKTPSRRTITIFCHAAYLCDYTWFCFRKMAFIFLHIIIRAFFFFSCFVWLLFIIHLKVMRARKTTGKGSIIQFAVYFNFYFFHSHSVRLFCFPLVFSLIWMDGWMPSTKINNVKYQHFFAKPVSVLFKLEP